MNERIKELAKQTGYIWHASGDPQIYEFTPEKLEKFAELIVRECIQTLIDNTPERYTNEVAEEDWDKGYDRAMKDCVHHIQEHFGVEE